MDRFKTNNVSYTHTDSLHIEKEHWDVLNRAGLVGDNICQGESDYKETGIIYGLFFAPKVKYCSTTDEQSNIEEVKFLNYSQIHKDY